MGEYFGYPKCCIDYFFSEDYYLGKFGHLLIGTGYVPCEECSKKTEEELIEVINLNRVCKTPFPDGNAVKMGGKFYVEFEKFMGVIL